MDNLDENTNLTDEAEASMPKNGSCAEAALNDARRNRTTTGDVWTIGTALEWTQGYLERKGDDNPRISAQWLLSEACGLSRIELYANFDRPLSMDERDVLRDYVARRGRGEPLQYITGEVGFRHITLRVRPGVLIPRPETEVLVSEVLSLLPTPLRPRAKEDLVALDADLSAGFSGDRDLNEARESISKGISPEMSLFSEDDRKSDDESSVTEQESSLNTSLLVADLCTGSGCIACSLAYEHPSVRVFATDISGEAIALAKENASALSLDDRIRFIECDLAEGIPQDFMGAFDLVVSNPPYVPTGILADISHEVADYEPALALDGGLDGLDVVRRMLPSCLAALKCDGYLAMELYETSLDTAAALVTETGFSDVRIVNDLTGRPRVLIARKSNSG